MTFTEHLYDYAYSLGYLLTAVVIFFIGKMVYQLLNPKIDVKNELVFKDNLAFAFGVSGYYAGLIIVIGSAIVGESRGFLFDLIDISIYSILGIVLLNLSALIVDKIILTKFDLRKEITEDRNSGAGVLKGVVFIGSALILFGSITGESNDAISGIFTATGYWLLGLIILLVTAKLYNLMLSYDLHAEIEKDNVAAGVAFSGALLAISIIIMNALLGDFNSWKDTLLEVGLESLLGFIVLPIMRFVSDKILLPGQKLTDEIVNQDKPNIGAGLIEAFAYVGSAILITWSL